MKISDDRREQIGLEIEILQKCKHPNIIKLFNVFIDSPNHRIYQLLEFADS